METEDEGTADNTEGRKVTYKDYMDVWAGLLDAPHIKVRFLQLYLRLVESLCSWNHPSGLDCAGNDNLDFLFYLY